MSNFQVEVAQRLLQINTIKIQPSSPFTWASGWLAPIYCDNRKILSYPSTRDFICDQFTRLIQEKYPNAEVIAGVATGAIAHGVLVAEKLGLPFIYVRPQPKSHGLENMIEGDLKAGQKVVIIEDLISTGGSSLKAVEAIRKSGNEVMGMLAIFTYGFATAQQNFDKAGVKLNCLSNYETLLQVASKTGYITEADMEALGEWRKDPANWKCSR